jgi:hypothetical protein
MAAARPAADAKVAGAPVKLRSADVVLGAFGELRGTCVAPFGRKTRDGGVET